MHFFFFFEPLFPIKETGLNKNFNFKEKKINLKKKKKSFLKKK